jgi:arginase
MIPSLQKEHINQFTKHLKSPRCVSIIGAPMTYGQPYFGTDTGPEALRDLNLAGALSSLGWRVEHNPDLCYDDIVHETSAELDTQSANSSFNAKNCMLVGKGSKLLADVVEEKARAGMFSLTIGGDHSVAIGTLAGVLAVRPNIGVIWVDAHADLNTPEISESGNMHGMPLGLLIEGMEVDYSKYRK